MAKTAIQKMREETWNGITDQNGRNPFFYRAYDEEGRIVASKEGIVTVPAEMQPRSRLVKPDLSVFDPQAVDPNNPIKAFKHDADPV